LLPVVVRHREQIERLGAADRAVPKIEFSHDLKCYLFFYALAVFVVVFSRAANADP
jgi:hypothetical protein